MYWYDTDKLVQNDKSVLKFCIPEYNIEDKYYAFTQEKESGFTEVIRDGKEVRFLSYVSLRNCSTLAAVVKDKEGNIFISDTASLLTENEYDTYFRNKFIDTHFTYYNVTNKRNKNIKTLLEVDGRLVTGRTAFLKEVNIDGMRLLVLAQERAITDFK